MGTSKTEVNLRRLLATAPKQQNQAKLIHYVATLREQLEQLAEERTGEGLPRVSKAVVSDYSEKIEAIASKLSSMMPDLEVPQESLASTSVKGSSVELEEETRISPSPGLRRRSVKLQEDLTDEMVGLARQLKESSILVSQSVQNSEKITELRPNLTTGQHGLKSCFREEAIERSLASTGHATSRASEIYSKSSATSCLTWLLMFVMICIFIMVVLLIRVT
ncbi:hypothetical protein G4B88_018876 [Cannabis sativa]|uniref:Vesicle transport protein USE1 n=1 Tax=Cannabis sativa TaxID=3483 RepID=A0A7J6E217_CANSA|nr:hypothetical protein G4B88_018876 [Cannabis sativa]